MEISEEQIQELKSLFDWFDQDGSQSLDTEVSIDWWRSYKN